MPNDTLQKQPSSPAEFSAGKIIRRHAARSSGKVSSSLPQASSPQRVAASSKQRERAA
jgi:hypothetical protein